MKQPGWLKPVGVLVTLVVAAILLAGIVAVPVTFASAPGGYDQPRLHWNTKNTTRFNGDTLPEIAVQDT